MNVSPALIREDCIHGERTLGSRRACDSGQGVVRAVEPDVTTCLRGFRQEAKQVRVRVRAISWRGGGSACPGPWRNFGRLGSAVRPAIEPPGGTPQPSERAAKPAASGRGGPSEGPRREDFPSRQRGPGGRSAGRAGKSSTANYGRASAIGAGDDGRRGKGQQSNWNQSRRTWEPAREGDSELTAVARANCRNAPHCARTGDDAGGEVHPVRARQIGDCASKPRCFEPRRRRPQEAQRVFLLRIRIYG